MGLVRRGTPLTAAVRRGGGKPVHGSSAARSGIIDGLNTDGEP
jgi:hypothetical protein